MVAYLASAPVVGGKSPPFLELHPSIDERLIAVFSSHPGSPPMPLDNRLLYRWTTSYSDPVADLRVHYGEYANNIRLSVFEGDFYIAHEVFSMPFADMEHAKIGVEATAYLQHMIEEPPAHEPLLAALGGEPIALRQHIERDLDNWKSNGMTPIFVFEGQSTVGSDEITLAHAAEAVRKTNHAWDLYSDNEPGDAVKTFGGSRAVRAQDLYRILQDVLVERDLDFIVAPFSACAQLAYLDQLETPFIDGIMGSQELLLYNIHDAIITPPSPEGWEKKSFSGIIKSELMKRLGGNITDEILVDALLMIGTSFLPTFPPLLDINVIRGQPPTLVDAYNLLRTHSKSITATCQSFSDILKAVDPDWLDKFRKAKMAVDHCVTAHVDGSVNVRSYDNLTEDHVKYLGYQLPSELYHYLSKALIGPRIMNCFNNSLQSVVFPTLDGENSDEYRRLVSQSLVPIKEATAAIIAGRINRWYGVNQVTMKYWFDPRLETALTRSIHLQPHPNEIADTWLVPDADLEAQSADGMTPGKLSFAVLSLKEKDFPKKTISNANAQRSKNPRLSSKSELLSNALWRLLHIRGYIDDQHELTKWGKALATTLKSIGPTVKAYKDVHHLEEAAFLAFELLRFDNLNSRNRHQELTGAPLRGSDDDKSNCILVGRTACLLKLRHKSIGYTGPLSKNFLSYYSIIKSVREADRDLLEAITVSMFMNHQVNRVRDDYGYLGRSLPFSADINIGLGIAVKTYLDDHMKLDQSPPLSPATAKETYAKKFLPNHVNIAEDFDVAFNFFDALYDGIKTLGTEISETDKKAWNNAKEYLAKRR